MSDGIGERQLLLYRPERESLLPGGFIYHIFVDRFAPPASTMYAQGVLPHTTGTAAIFSMLRFEAGS